MKKYLLAFAICIVSVSAFSQDTEKKKLSFSIGAEGAIPVGDFKDIYSVGFGGTLLGEYMVSKSFGVTLNAGYLNFSGKDYNIPGIGTVSGESVGQIPVLAGARYYFIKDIYVSGQLGASFFTGDGSSTGFTYAPGIGVKFSVLDATLKYMGTSLNDNTFSNIGLRIAYTF